MLGIILRVIAIILWVVAAANQVLFHQGELDLIAWGLAFYGTGCLLGGVGPGWPVRGA